MNEGAVLKIAYALNVQVKPEDIDICHLVKRKRSSPIFVRFVSHKVKSSLYKQSLTKKRTFCRYISGCSRSISSSGQQDFH